MSTSDEQFSSQHLSQPGVYNAYSPPVGRAASEAKVPGVRPVPRRASGSVGGGAGGDDQDGALTSTEKGSGHRAELLTEG